MSEPFPLEPPPRTTLPQTTQNYIRLLETQLSIAYPTNNLWDSSQLRWEPLLKLVVGLIIMLSKQSGPSSNSCSKLLDEWLQFGEDELPSLHDCKAMVLSIKTPPIFTGLLTTKFTVNKKRNYSTTHHIELMISLPNVVPESLEGVDSPEGSVWNPEHPCRPLTLLVFNARGASNPHYINILPKKISELNPDIVIVTETRSPIINSFEQGNALQFDSSLTIDSPLNFFGGAWFLWHSSRTSIEPVTKEMATGFQAIK
ncbi:hypothetical protein COLO4_36442 [Corchorus olitorius]|uniref:Endonuclease/exonuclease/phosphatase n=1 Tax=Corchorus olitorius TaxID=93759 RepID=A0A1R3G8Y5_9ROSI|nr:hypothetical protein COLO4_36442 [Corchorus olitorius]